MERYVKVRCHPLKGTCQEKKGYIPVEVSYFDPDPQTIASHSIGYLKRILKSLKE